MLVIINPYGKGELFSLMLVDVMTVPRFTSVIGSYLTLNRTTYNIMTLIRGFEEISVIAIYSHRSLITLLSLVAM